MHLARPHRGSTSIDTFSLRSFTQLQSVTIRDGSADYWPQLSQILETISSPLRILSVSCIAGKAYPAVTAAIDANTSYDDPGFDASGLELLDAVFQRETFSALHTVEFYIRQEIVEPLTGEQAERADASVNQLCQKKLPNLFKRPIQIKVLHHRCVLPFSFYKALLQQTLNNTSKGCRRTTVKIYGKRVDAAWGRSHSLQNTATFGRD